ncbi:Aldolase-type TIM barrel [Moorella glycerini]|uniref:PDZ domain-containing protein n=1 Tax=Neomoorella stamsii TaxID=1266720 RepID=A0A9X7P6B2_9FIRM|nr:MULTISPECIES: DUF512 domain-containing protein [Moorella]PRR73024.1 hypothetical protein MOST_15700 [Moorella stamsii]CEP67695.1 Aldolase-type TIM barrel [Moorella glycerini]
MSKQRAVITAVRPDSIAAELGINPGDVLVAINGEPVPDLIVYRYLCAGENLEVEIEKPGGERWLVEIEKDYDEDLGLEFAVPTFDGLRRCSNKCLFCFVDQMPRGLRPGLYIKDDDYRYSFLHGNFITLTNLKPRDWEYIFRWHLSPLYISVHTTNPQLRYRLLGNQRGGEIMVQLKKLAAAGIQMHTQIVLCPGLNDGPELERTVKDLSSLYPAVQSIAVVPVGLTSRRENLFPLRRVTPKEAAAIANRITAWQAEFRHRFERGLVYGADELYLLANLPLPQAPYYDDFPQTENGVGLTRLFLDDFAAALANLNRPEIKHRRVVIATGTLAATLLAGLVQEATARAGNLEARVIPVPNLFFGPQVTVAGLLTGQDLLRGLKEAAPWVREKEGVILIPDVMLKKDAPVFLDDLTPEALARELGVEVQVIPATGRGLVEGLLKPCGGILFA